MHRLIMFAVLLAMSFALSCETQKTTPDSDATTAASSKDSEPAASDDAGTPTKADAGKETPQKGADAAAPK